MNNQILEQWNHWLDMMKHLLLITNKSEIALTSCITTVSHLSNVLIGVFLILSYEIGDMMNMMWQ